MKLLSKYSELVILNVDLPPATALGLVFESMVKIIKFLVKHFHLVKCLEDMVTMHAEHVANSR